MSTPMDRLFERLRHGDATSVEEIFPATLRSSMLAAIVAGEAVGSAAGRPRGIRARAFDRWRRPGRRVALASCAAFMACALAVALVIAEQAGPAATPSPPAIHASVVSFRYPTRGPDAGYITATVTDPFAAQSSLDAAFRAAGLDITVSLVPASPSAVGTLVESSGPGSGPQIAALSGGTCVTGGGGPGNCPVGVKIPRDFRGAGSVVLGRPANPGEDYESTNSVFSPGESLHCSALIGSTVATASSALASRGITARWQTTQSGGAAGPARSPGVTPTATNSTSTTASNTSSASTSETTTSSTSSASGPAGSATAPPSDYHVLDGVPIRAGVVMLVTQEAPVSASVLAQDTRMFDAGCSS
ncbi:MAG TPA: hypothetical protein VKS25_01030 [Solirubrobacteraceae bacterium]|nr:hypothetical protein [Solirubrobacteraceae bacterium]